MEREDHGSGERKEEVVLGLNDQEVLTKRARGRKSMGLVPDASPDNHRAYIMSKALTQSLFSLSCLQRGLISMQDTKHRPFPQSLLIPMSRPSTP